MSALRAARVDANGVAPPSTTTVSDPRYSHSLEAGLAILRCFTAKRTVLGIAEVAARLRFSRSTTHRYVATLAALGYLEQTPSHEYTLAPRAADVGTAALESQSVRRHARALLERLREKTGHTASLGVLEGTDLLYLERVRGYGRHRSEIDLGILGLRVGCRVPAQCTAAGKLLLASLPEPRRRERIARLELRRRGPRSITTRKALREELQRIPPDGPALSDRELAEALVSIAAPVRDPSGAVVAALALEAHTAVTTPEDLLRDAGPHLTAAAAELSGTLDPAYEQAPGRPAVRAAARQGGQRD